MDKQVQHQGLLCFDFDGTLHCPKAEELVSSKFLVRLAELSAEGYLWGINTGRSFEYLIEGVEEVNFPLRPDFIVAREREIYWFDQPTQQWQLDNAWSKECDRLHDEVFEREKEAIAKVQSYVLEKTKAEWVSMPGDLAGVIATSIEEMEAILKVVRKETDHISDLSYLRSTIYMRFTHAEYHKGTSLDYVRSHFNVPVEKVVAMGDGENDLGMLDLDVAGMIACPENADYVVKKRVVELGGFIASKASSLGVLQALDVFIENKIKNSET